MKTIDMRSDVKYNSDIVFREIDGNIHILGEGKKYRHHMVHDAKTGKLVLEDSFKKTWMSEADYIDAFFSLVFSGGSSLFQKEKIWKNDIYSMKINEFQKANLADLEKAVKDIKVYQGTIEGAELELIDTGKPETFIRARDTFWLRAKAYALGADAVINYQSGSSIGTPVKYKK